MFEIKIKDHFSAAHQLVTTTKKCENLHGHNWDVEICVIGKKLNSSGILVDFQTLKKKLKKILKNLDHKFLNDLNFFPNNNPSSENIAVYISQEMTKNTPEIKISKVSVWESDNSCATYYPTQ